jgi:hypothetical protein
MPDRNALRSGSAWKARPTGRGDQGGHLVVSDKLIPGATRESSALSSPGSGGRCDEFRPPNASIGQRTANLAQTARHDRRNDEQGES